MFKKEMAEKLKAIFGVKEVKFDEPGESFEQDTLFVEVQKCRSNTGQGRATARVTGALIFFSQNEKLSYGFFNKRLQQASGKLTAPFYFFDIDVEALGSQARYQNISERRASFVYLYSAQYDPNQGQLTGVEINVEIEGS